MEAKAVYLSTDIKRWTLQDNCLNSKEFANTLTEKGILIGNNAKNFLEEVPPEDAIYDLVLLEISDLTSKRKITRKELLEIAKTRGLDPCSPRAPFFLREAYTDQDKEIVTIFVDSNKEFAPYFDLWINNGAPTISCGYSIETKKLWNTNLIVFQKK